MRQTALITGASSGIGLDFAHLFAADGYDVVLVARSEGKLRALAGELRAKHNITAHVVTSDLSRPDAPQQLFDSVPVPVDVLVNNAGYGLQGPEAIAPWSRRSRDPYKKRDRDRRAEEIQQHIPR